MILDKVFHGVLDQGRGCLLIFEEPEADRAYGAAIDTLEQVGKVVDSLYAKVRSPYEAFVLVVAHKQCGADCEIGLIDCYVTRVYHSLWHSAQVP